MIFVNSMSDIFHEDIPLKFLINIFETIQNTSHHAYQILTKQSRESGNARTKITVATKSLDGCEHQKAMITSGVLTTSDELRPQLNS